MFFTFNFPIISVSHTGHQELLSLNNTALKNNLLLTISVFCGDNQIYDTEY